jgi:DNA polymerase bacteriophage-type
MVRRVIERLHIDHETRGAVDLKKVGTDVYFSDPLTKILMTAYAFNDSPVKVWIAHEGPMPDELLDAYANPKIKKCAWNAAFERTGLDKQFGIFIPFEQWEDPSVGARHMSMPGNLNDVGHILGLPTELWKNEEEGAVLRKLFTEPQRVKRRKPATNENTLFDISPIGEPKIEYEWATHLTHPKEWEKFVEYCRQDVVAERAVQKCTDVFPLTDMDRKMWYLDQKINYTGIAADKDFASKCFELAKKDKEAYVVRLKEITGLDNPVSNQQMLGWVQARGYPNNSLRKEPVGTALVDEQVKLTPEGRKALSMLKYAKKTSYTKLEAITTAISADGRLRNQFIFMGSARAGRWTGQNVQMQNMARPIKALGKPGALDKAIELIHAEDYAGLQAAFPKDPVIDVVTSCIRSSFIASPGHRLDVCDLGAIENRVLGWVSGEDKILKVFRDGLDPYLDFASRWFNIPYAVLEAAYNAHDPDAEFKRQISKPAVLGCGYRQAGGDWGTHPQTGDRVKTGLWKYAEDMHCPMTKDQAHQAVNVFRSEYKKVVDLWYSSEKAVIKCLKTGSTEWIGPTKLVWCSRKKRKDGTYILRIHLPSGRCLYYLNARVEERTNVGRDGVEYKKDTIIYEGIDQIKKIWTDIFTHGGKIVENVVQAIARDILVHAMLLADDIGLKIVAHVHDEIVTENPDTEYGLGLEDLTWCMSQVALWAPGLPLTAKGYSDKVYKKG